MAIKESHRTKFTATGGIMEAGAKFARVRKSRPVVSAITKPNRIAVSYVAPSGKTVHIPVAAKVQAKPRQSDRFKGIKSGLDKKFKGPKNISGLVSKNVHYGLANVQSTSANAFWV